MTVHMRCMGFWVIMLSRLGLEVQWRLCTDVGSIKLFGD